VCLGRYALTLISVKIVMRAPPPGKSRGRRFNLVRKELEMQRSQRNAAR
jgi:hypothetical protein